MLTHPEFSFVVQGSVSSLQSTSVHLNNQGIGRGGRTLGGGGYCNWGPGSPPPLVFPPYFLFCPHPNKIVVTACFSFCLQFFANKHSKIVCGFRKIIDIIAWIVYITYLAILMFFFLISDAGPYWQFSFTDINYTNNLWYKHTRVFKT